MTGVIVKYIPPKGYGFIKPDGDEEKEIFFHTKAIREGASKVQEGAFVEYEVGRDRDDRARAIKVRVHLGEGLTT